MSGLSVARAMVLVAQAIEPAAVCADGDSNTYGYVGVDHETEAWPSVMAAALNGSFELTNIAVSGYTIQDILDHVVAEADTLVADHGRFARGCAVQNLYICMGGTNRETDEQDPWIQWTKMRGNVIARLAAGFSHVIVMGILPSGTSQLVEGRRKQYAAYALRDPLYGKGFHWVDPAVITELSDPTNVTYYDGDQTHLNTAGQAVLGAWMAAFVNTLTGVPA